MFNVLQKTAAGGAALAAVGALLAPAPAAAQSYYGDRYDRPYDQCRYDRTSRTGSGAIIGGGLGAVAGSQLAARGRRTEGSILGAVVGGLIGGAVGNNASGNCYGDNYRYDDRYDRYDSRYDNSDRYRDDAYAYDRYQDDRYDDRYDRYDDRYSSGGYAAYTAPRYDRSYSYDSYYSSDSGYRYGNGYSDGYSSQCRTVTTTTRDWNGRLVTHYRQVC